MVESRSYQRELHNYAARQGKELSYQDVQSGALNDPVWTAVASLNSVEYGRGQGRTKHGAREEASRKALATIAAGY